MTSPIQPTHSFSSRLREYYVHGQERWPGALIEYTAFVKRVAEVLGTDKPSEATLSRYPTDDLYLAVALEQDLPRAHEHFYREYHPFILAISRKYALNTEDAEDVAQNLCATISKRIARYQGRGSLRGWIARIVPNVTRDLYRSGAEAWERSLDGLTQIDPDEGTRSDAPILSDAGAGANSVRAHMDRSKCAEMFEKTIESAMTHLTDEQAELIRYKYIQGLTGREIARIRDVGEYVISKHMKKALARLQKRILMAATSLFAFSSQEVRDCLDMLE